VATHDPETLLSLVGKVARAAARAGNAPSAAVVSMAAFNSAKLGVDRSRGINDPENDPARTPTAQAIQMRFSKLAGRPVPWQELLAGALRSQRDRIMWLAALRREDRRENLSDEIVVHALRLVAAHQGVDTLTLRQYVRRRDAMVSEDRQLHGDEGVLEALLPSGNQILAYCELGWENALRLAGMTAVARQHEQHRKPPPQTPGIPAAELAAIYAALNGSWPSRTTLSAFASSCATSVASLSGPMSPVRKQAARLLTAQGIEPPADAAPRALGKGKRLSYRYPTGGIPGAPRRGRYGPRHSSPDNKRQEQLRRELVVLSLRIWLGDLSAADRRTRSAYLDWQVGTGYTPASAFDKHELGGFSKLKQQAAEENSRVAAAGGEPLADARRRVQAFRDKLAESKLSDRLGAVEPVPFGEALRAVLAGPHAEVLAPKQA